jgi:hypothetical protein
MLIVMLVFSCLNKAFFMKEESQFQSFPAYVQKSSPKFNPFILVIIIVIFALLGGGGYYYFGVMKKEASNVSPVPNAPKPTAVVSPTVSASVSGAVTPAAKELERGKLQIAVLNGSGTAGAAKGTSSHLNSLGYDVTKVDNADDFDYTGLTINVKKGKSEYLPLLKKDLAENDPKVIITTNVDDTIETDAEVIVGK